MLAVTVMVLQRSGHFFCILWMECIKRVSAAASNRKKTLKLLFLPHHPGGRKTPKQTHRYTALIYNQLIKLLWLICMQNNCWLQHLADTQLHLICQISGQISDTFKSNIHWPFCCDPVYLLRRKTFDFFHEPGVGTFCARLGLSKLLFWKRLPTASFRRLIREPNQRAKGG